MRKDTIRISVIVPTRNRPDDLEELLRCLCAQRRAPYEVILVDGSSTGSARNVAKSFRLRFRSRGCRLKYVRGGYDGLPTARNLGVRYANGEAVLFMDDDTLPDRKQIDALADFLKDHPSALGLQTRVKRLGIASQRSFPHRLWNATSKVLMLSYSEENRMGVRRSVERVTPGILTMVIPAQALFGCSFCFRRSVFVRFRFDMNLKRSAYLEDLDFSYRVYRSHPNSLYAIPNALVLHKASPTSRMPSEQVVNMNTVYRFYVFFKNFSKDSMLNLFAFLWGQIGQLLKGVLTLLLERRSSKQCWELVYLVRSYLLALQHLREILRAELAFFNNGVTSTP